MLLYELLTGTTPFDQETFRKAAFDEIRRIIREEEPPRPSTRLSTLEATATTVSANRQTDPRRLGRLLRGELDWIVMKALEKDRSRRYETANGLAADVRRYLDDEPVEAGPPSAWYRLRKFARRNRAALATAAVVATALVAGHGGEHLAGDPGDAGPRGWPRTGWTPSGPPGLEVTQERNRADLARQEADRRATEAREVVDFLINDLIGAAAPSRAQGTIPTVDQVLARADQNIAKKFADRPLIEASIRHALGKAYEELGQYPKAEQHAARAVELRLAHLGPEHAETIAAQNALGWALVRQGKKREARTLLTPSSRPPARCWDRSTRRPSRRCTVLAAALRLRDTTRPGPSRRSCWPSGSGCWAPSIPRPSHDEQPRQYLADHRQLREGQAALRAGPRRPNSAISRTTPVRSSR